MRSYIERAKDFIVELFPYVREWESIYYLQKDIRDFNKQNSRNVILKHGIARVALITSDYVVKYDYDHEEASVVGGCEAEVAIYADAEKDGFAYLFAKITRFDYNGRSFYIMPRIRGINPNNWYHADHYMTDEENDWCDEHHLSDLHYNNYGFRNGKVCLVDYACNLSEESDTDCEY